MSSIKSEVVAEQIDNAVGPDVSQLISKLNTTETKKSNKHGENIKLKVKHSGKKKNWTGYVTDFVTQVTWSGANTEASRTLTFSLVYSPNDKEMNPPLLSKGDVVTFYHCGKRIFVGHITQRDRTGEGTTTNYTAKDLMHNMLQSHITKKYKKKTPEYIAKDVCKQLGIKTGSLAKTSHKINKHYGTDNPAYNVIMKAYYKASQDNKKEYMPRMNGDKFEVIEKGKMVEGFVLKDNANIIQSRESENVDEMVNKVIIYNSKNKKIGEVKKSDWIKKYGTYQSVLTSSKSKGKSKAKKMLKGGTKEMELGECLGNIRCIAGRGVYVRDDRAGMKGKFWIQSDTHTWQDGIHKMSLVLTLKNVTENPSMSYNKPASKSGGSATVSKSGKKVWSGKKVKAVFTAYCLPGNTTANGEKTDGSKRTCAAPRSIKFGTKIEVLGTHTSCDGKLYRVNDRGGAIVVKDGVYHFDLYMPTVARAKSFGRRKGYAIIGDGKGWRYTSKASGKWVKPVKHYTITGRYHEKRDWDSYNLYHKGIDLAAPTGTAIHAANAGTVCYAGYPHNGYGLHVCINHHNGLYTRYAHMSRCLVHVGQKVSRNQIIGKVGSTEANGPHCHFEFRKGGIWGPERNPSHWIKF